MAPARKAGGPLGSGLCWINTKSAHSAQSHPLGASTAQADPAAPSAAEGGGATPAPGV